jgi:ribonuclease Z
VEIFEMDHSVPTIGYGIGQIKQKLKPEYANLSSKELGSLRKSNVEFTYEYIHPSLAYVCDTSIRVFDLNPNLLKYQTIIIECTFLYMEHKPNAVSTQHIHWFEIKPYIESNPMIDFILIHFSMQYKDSEIAEFFNSELENLSNVKVWI